MHSHPLPCTASSNSVPGSCGGIVTFLKFHPRLPTISTSAQSDTVKIMSLKRPVALAFLVLADPSSALSVPGTGLTNAVKSSIAAAACSASLLCGNPMPAMAVPPTIEEVIVEFTEASYPMILSLDPSFSGFTERVGKLVLDIEPKKLGKAIDLGLDVFTSVPSGTIDTFNNVIKESFSGLSTATCQLVPLPPATSAARFTTIAAQAVPGEKIKAFEGTWGNTLKLLPKTESAICLPPVSALDKLALAQADVGRTFDFDKSRAFFAYTVPMIKGEVKLTDECVC